jgi:hypothetical protein
MFAFISLFVVIGITLHFTQKLMRRYLIAIFLLLSLFASSQTVEHDWENYVVSVDGRPVSINVDLGLFTAAPLKERPFVIILRTKIKSPDTKGMPYSEENGTLLQIEDALIGELGKETGAIFAGRFTQRGLREFYFYAPDTIGYEKGVNQAMKNFPAYEWLSRANDDKKWENYYTVLYPADVELIKIRSKRQIEKISQSNLATKKEILINHFFSFNSFSNREKFLRELPWTGFQIMDLPESVDFKTNKFTLTLQRKAIPELLWIDHFIIPLYRYTQKLGGKYVGWEQSK